MPVNFRQAPNLNTQRVDPIQALLSGQNLADQLRSSARNKEVMSLQDQLAAEGGGINSAAARQLASLGGSAGAGSLTNLKNLSTARLDALEGDANTALGILQGDDIPGTIQFVRQRLEELSKDPEADTADTRQLLSWLEAGDPQSIANAVQGLQRVGNVKSVLKQAEQAKSAGQREFDSLTKDLTKEKKQDAILVKLGLKPRAVGSAIQTISDEGIAEQIGKASGTIKQREKFGELTGSSRAKTIDKGFESINRISKGINTIDRAITAIEGGAGVGSLNKFLPSFRAASVELDQIENQLALDVIGGVTLGAISEEELKLAKTVALPKGLEGPQLIEHLQQRRAAQDKLRSYFNDQIQHLDQGGTVASFLRKQEREAEGQQDPQLGQPQATGQQLNFDAQGNLIQ